eukprot:TRINITY_DN1051_c0_g1_i1.p1 TRINITY_DN1051_c0_g1~~TRINITY_DN1051_c0_g1_i1.p1  ORF type:complete len:147 (-),score=17.15 TRINITY_DN1051_c0_g1_i1:178-618(-)
MTPARQDSGSAAESGHTSMDDTSQGGGRHQQKQQKRNHNHQSYTRTGGVRRDEGGAGEEDTEMWAAFSESFKQVQMVLDQNRVLIAQVNENHQSKIPDNLTKNVALIREINSNISKVVSLYSHLSADFSNIFHQRRHDTDNDAAAA